MTAPTLIVQNSPPGTSYGFGKCCEAIRDAVPLVEVARRYTHLEPFGGKAWFTGRCPLPDHEDKTPSFYIYPPGRFWCYGCGRGGDVVDLEFHCGDYGELWEAMVSLAVEYGVELPTMTPQTRKRSQKRREKEDLYLRQARACHRTLEKHSRVREWWEGKSWRNIAEAVCQGDESMIVALARVYVETQEALT